MNGKEAAKTAASGGVETAARTAAKSMQNSRWSADKSVDRH